LSGRGLCDELITRPEESYRLCCVVVCDLESSRIGAPYIYDIRSLRVKESVLQRVYIWKHREKINVEHNDEPYVGIFSLEIPSLLVRDPELVENILVKGCQYFMDRQISMDEIRDLQAG